MSWLMKIVKWVPSNIAGIIGIVQAVVTVVREFCIVAARVLCPLIPGEKDDNIVKGIRKVADWIDACIESIKNWFLG